VTANPPVEKRRRESGRRSRREEGATAIFECFQSQKNDAHQPEYLTQQLTTQLLHIIFPKKHIINGTVPWVFLCLGAFPDL
jgi:hypothetical protein